MNNPNGFAPNRRNTQMCMQCQQPKETKGGQLKPFFRCFGCLNPPPAEEAEKAAA